MRKRHLSSEKVVNIAGSAFLTIAFVASILLYGDESSVIELLPIKIGRPITSILLPSFYGILATYGYFLIFKPNPSGQVFLCFAVSIMTMLTNYEFLAVFLFFFGIIIFLLSCPNSTHKPLKIKIMCVFHYASIFCIFPHGWYRLIFVLSTSLFFMILQLWIYSSLREKFTSYLQKITLENQIIKEKPGEQINLKEYGLSERQISITKDYLYHRIPYKDLSKKYITSLSSIKKDFSLVFKKIGVSNIHEMTQLLQQYQIL